MILLLDTSAPLCKLTVIDGAQQFPYEWQADRQLAKGLLGFIVDTLAKHDLAIEDLLGIGVFRGPGSFTGLRIGATVANTIASGAGIPIVGETTDGWQSRVVERLNNGDDEKIVLPLYDRPANITQPRK